MQKLLIILILFCGLVVNAQKPTIKGGLSAFIVSKVVYPAYSLQNCIQGRVNVGFKLNEKGEVYFTTITKSVLGDLDKEALRVIKLTSKKWQIPAGYDINSLLVVPVNFVLKNHDCNGATQNGIDLAIAEYDKQDQLEQTVINYYKALEVGKADHADEYKIISIKKTLGIDEAYLKELLEIGIRKAKQGDVANACEDFIFVKYMGSKSADEYLAKYCKK